METSISCRVDNLIKNYCDNFLSYLYAGDGWKRTMFDMGKENYIPSYMDKNKKIRILISNTGSILITCEYVIDILTSIDFIVSQFEQNRMGWYIIDDEITVKTNYVTKVPLNFIVEERNYIFPIGSIDFSENLAILKYTDSENKDKLILEIWLIYEADYQKSFHKKEDDDESFSENEEEETFSEEQFLNEINLEDDLFTEFILLSSFFIWASLKAGVVF